MNLKREKPDDYQLAKEKTDQSFLVSASAGTGKTRVLVERYINILRRSKIRIDEIAAITFTEKAAAEMKERIRRALRSPNQTDVSHSAALIDQLSAAPISTIHSFCARVLQENVDEIGIDPQFRIIDEVEEQILRQESLHGFLHRELSQWESPAVALTGYFELPHIREMLNTVWRNQNDFAKPLQQIAEKTGPEIYNRTQQHYRNYTLQLFRRAFLTPQVAQACEFLDAHNARSPDDKLQQAKTILLNAIAQIKNGRIPTQLNDGSLAKAFGLNNKGNKKNWGGELETMRENHRYLREVWDSIKSRLFPFDDELEQKNAALLIHFARLALRWIDFYRRFLNEKSAVDFNGLEILTAAFFESKSRAAEHYAKRFRHLLVDEFQDISPVQDRILTAICELNPALITFYVGDEKQSIYRFRGAEVEIFNGYKRRKQLLYLDKNFRSIKPLNEFFNRFFSDLMNDDEAAPEYDVHYEKPVKSHDTTVTKNVPVELLLLNTEDETGDGATGLSAIDAEFVNVVNEMHKLRNRKIIRDESGNLRQPKWRDFTILLRSRTHQEKLERILNRAGVPFYVSSGVGFYQRREVLDVINFLRALLNWHDELALIGALRSPMVGISDDALTALATENGLMAGLQKLINSENDNELSTNREAVVQFRRFMEIYNRLHDKLASASTAELLQAILTETDYLAVLAAFPGEEQSIANVLKLVDLTVEWSAARDISPVDFIRRIQLYQTMQIREGEANLSSEIEDSVTIMTVHAAKGLQFPIVVLPALAVKTGGAYSRLLTDSSELVAMQLKTAFDDSHGYYYRYLSQREKDRELAEEKRILYVAATRAKSYLLLSAVDKPGKNSAALWPNIKAFLEKPAAGVMVKECSLADAAEIFGKFEKTTTGIHKPLTEEQKKNIRAMVPPLPVTKRVQKVTPTAFAAWVSHQAGESALYEKYPAGKDVFESATTLTAAEIGTIIHRAFSWWDFRDIQQLCDYTAQLIKPFALDSVEEQKMLEMFKGWGRKFGRPENALLRYIREARQLFREVDVHSRLFDIPAEGKIDLLLKMQGGEYIVVDFKSDHIADAPDPATMRKYNAQLDLYALMLRQYSQLKVSKTGLYFIRNGLLIEQECTPATISRTETRLREFING